MVPPESPRQKRKKKKKSVVLLNHIQTDPSTVFSPLFHTGHFYTRQQANVAGLFAPWSVDLAYPSGGQLAAFLKRRNITPPF